MGKHSSGAQWPFYRSIIAWVLPWVILATVIVGASWATVRAIGGDELAAPTPGRGSRPSVAASPSADPSPSEEAEETEEDADRPKKDPMRSKKQAEKKDDKKTGSTLITKGISVQVLNGTSASSADDRMGDRLARLGFRVVALGRASVGYDETTVFWSYPEAKPAARALAKRFDWASGRKPGNLSTTVDLHVIVGKDGV